MASEFELLPAEAVTAAERHSFLRKAFAPEKAEFLCTHEDWAYHQSKAVYYIRDAEGRLAAYNALIEGTVFLEQQPQKALWLVDIIVLPDYRGKGLQRLLDGAVRDSSTLQLGFPNKLAAPIHKKHGWGVRQEAYKLTLPLSLRVAKQIRYSQKIAAQVARAASALVSPLYFAQWAFRAKAYQAAQSARMETLGAQDLAEVFFAAAPQQLTSYRDAAFIQWRYLDAPYAHELRFYHGGNGKIALVCRVMEHQGLKTLRILDIWGNLDDAVALEDLLRLLLADAAQLDLEQITAICSHPRLLRVFERLGFWLKAPVDFCWYSPDASTMQMVADAASHWVYADSDFDYP